MTDRPEQPPADFAMLRAVEILAQMHDARRNQPNTPPLPLEGPVVLRSERIRIDLGSTTRAEIERQLGVAFSYPARGWHTYATNEGGRRCFLSLFYSGGALVAAEIYVPRSDRAPKLAPANLGGFTFDPGGIAIGTNADAIGEIFVPSIGGPAKVVYDRSFEARFPGGVAYAMSRKGVIERLALYSDIRRQRE